MTLLPIAILTLVCMFTYSFEIIFGLAGTIMMLPIMVYFFDAKTLVVYSTLPQILVASIGLIRSPRTVEIRFLGGMLLYAVLGAVAGIALFYYISTDVFHILLAMMVTLFGLYLIVAPDRLRVSPAAGRILDGLAGSSQALFGISGPIAMTRLLATFRKKTVVRNYALAFFLAMNIFRSLAYAAKGTFTPDVMWMMLASFPFLAVTLWFGNRLHFRINEKLFRRVVAWIILMGGISLLYH